jgi:hypothetical protein
MADPRVTCPTLGARNLEQFNDTIKGADMHPTPEQRAASPAVLAGR